MIMALSIPSYAKSIPYFANIRTEEANIRTGPSVKYPIRWVYKRKNWPVKVTATFETWRKVSDIYGKAGWIHESLLSDQRYVITYHSPITDMHESADDSSPIIQKIEKGVVSELIECNEEQTWCNLSIAEKTGWVKASELWGVK